MQKEFLFFTAGQFAKLHQLNKRTLHYYDDIGLFSPSCKGENGYRYYTYGQSPELESILALRDLGMSIEEIKDYLKQPNTEKFLKIAAQKTKEIDKQIERLTQMKALLREKQDTLIHCKEIYDGKIEIIQEPKKYLLLTPAATADLAQIMTHLQAAWMHSAYKTGCGSYISLDKVKQGQFETYDGLFTSVASPKKGGNFQVRPKGTYLCGYCVGEWEKIPAFYLQMLDYATANGIELVGNCYEIGLNEFAISHMKEYVTQIEIQCK